MDTSSAYWYTLLINLYYFSISGALASSVLKKLTPAAKLFGLPAWLAIHEVIGILILLFTIAATAVIFIAKQNFLNDPHTYLGLSLLVFALVNVIWGFFRKIPVTQVFKNCHQLIGYISIVIGCAASLTGLNYWIDAGRLDYSVFYLCLISF